jgi:hypothetical protein
MRGDHQVAHRPDAETLTREVRRERRYRFFRPSVNGVCTENPTSNVK